MYKVLFFYSDLYVENISSKQRICGLASDERMMDAKYLNHKFKLFTFLGDVLGNKPRRT